MINLQFFCLNAAHLLASHPKGGPYWFLSWLFG